MSSTLDSSGNPGGARKALAGVHTAIVAPGDEVAYQMVDATEIDAHGAFLAGALLFELGEELVVQLSFGNQISLRVRARVVVVERGAVAGMRVEFVELSDAVKNTITGLANGR